MPDTASKYYRLPLFDGLEALQASGYRTSFPAHYHSSFNITLVYEGVFRTQLQDRLIVAPAGTIVITNPGEIHANPFKKEDRVSFFTFYINAPILEQAFFPEKTIYDDALFAALHLAAIQIGKNHPLGEENLIQALRELADRHGSQPMVTEPPLELFNEFIQTEDPDKFSLAKAADKFGVDKFKFIRLFKFQTGLTPHNYFILKRIEKSKLLLADGRDLLGVAVELGFYDAAHYCHHFKKFTGISPKAYLGSCNILQ